MLTAKDIAVRLLVSIRTARRELARWRAVWEAYDRAVQQGGGTTPPPACPRPRLVPPSGPEGGRPHYEVDDEPFGRWSLGLAPSGVTAPPLAA